MRRPLFSICLLALVVVVAITTPAVAVEFNEAETESQVDDQQEPGTYFFAHRGEADIQNQSWDQGYPWSISLLNPLPNGAMGGKRFQPTESTQVIIYIYEMRLYQGPWNEEVNALLNGRQVSAFGLYRPVDQGEGSKNELIRVRFFVHLRNDD